MEENFEQYKEEIINESFNKNNFNNLNNDSLRKQNNSENINSRRNINPEYSFLLNKYKILDMENFKKNIYNKEDYINTGNNKSNNNFLKEKELTELNNDYTKQINDIISKNFKNGLDSNQNIYINSYLGNNQNNNNYLELERERKLLLLKNIELEKEINNLNNYVDINNKLVNNNKNSSLITNITKNSNNINKNPNSISINSLYSKNKNKKKDNYTFPNKINKNNKNNIKIDYNKEINETLITIKNLDNRINELKQEINNNYTSNNNKWKDKIKEIKIWRETFYEEYEKYRNLLKDLKENLNNDKILYNDVIWKMKQKASDNINIIYENYKNQIIENDKKLDFLKKENQKLVNKENKVKEIYLYNFK